jgi:hypothetical protein
MESEAELTSEVIRRRRGADKDLAQVSFAVTDLYGLSTHSIRMPLGNGESVESGQICITVDPEADPTQNTGIADFKQQKIFVRYGIQAVFPGLYELVTRGGYDPDLLRPVRATATDECTMNEEMTGWRAFGCLDFLPGSLWAGAEGG